MSFDASEVIAASLTDYQVRRLRTPCLYFRSAKKRGQYQVIMRLTHVRSLFLLTCCFHFVTRAFIIIAADEFRDTC